MTETKRTIEPQPSNQFRKTDAGAFHPYRLVAVLAIGVMTGGTPVPTRAADAEPSPASNSVAAWRVQAMKAHLSKPFKVDAANMIGTAPFAVSAYWLNEREAEADAAVIRAASPDAPGVGSYKDEKGIDHYHRQVFLLQRVYFLFNSRSEYFPGRMSKAAEDAVAESMWKWASTACTKEMCRPESPLWVPSGNITFRNTASLWGATQILADHPAYRDRIYADGTPVQEMAQAFNDGYKVFLHKQASKGLMVEVASDYNDYSLDSWFNIADFSRDPRTRQCMKMYLDIYWADWAIEQIDGVRGGSRHRCYPGRNSLMGAGGGGTAVGWLFGVGQRPGCSPKTLGAATTTYRPSPLVSELVRAGAARGTYEYVSRRLGRGITRKEAGLPEAPAKDPGTSEDAKAVGAHAEAYASEGGNLLRYTFCTPDFIMGTSMRPALPVKEWVAISSQNIWEGVIAGRDPEESARPQGQQA